MRLQLEPSPNWRNIGSCVWNSSPIGGWGLCDTSSVTGRRLVCSRNAYLKFYSILKVTLPEVERNFSTYNTRTKLESLCWITQVKRHYSLAVTSSLWMREIPGSKRGGSSVIFKCHQILRHAVNAIPWNRGLILQTLTGLIVDKTCGEVAHPGNVC